MLDTARCAAFRLPRPRRPWSPARVPGSPRRDRTLLSGRYRLLERIGRGAAATVWLAHDERLDRRVAVKQVSLDGHPDLGAWDPLGEARLVGRVRHPNVVAVHDVIEQDRSLWLVLDHLPATTLAALVRQRGPLGPTETAVVGLDVLAALRAVHRAGIVHCDVKPANLMVSPDGTTTLVDFGIAQLAGTERPGRDAGMVVGSPSYMAPELVRGERPRPAADLWALGATLYCAVEGRAPFAQPDPGPTLAAVLQDPPRPALRAGPLRPLLHRLLVKDPAERASHDEVSDLLDAVLAGTPDRPCTPGSAPPTDWRTG